MNRYARSIASAFVATIVLSALMLLKAAMGLLPAMNVVHLLAGLAHALLGLPASPVVGWIAHFAIGSILWGIGFALLYHLLPGNKPVIKGLSFSVLAWVLMMLIPLPMAGAGFFGLHLAPLVPVVTLILHLIWGAVLGAVFGLMARNAPHVSDTREAG